MQNFIDVVEMKVSEVLFLSVVAVSKSAFFFAYPPFIVVEFYSDNNTVKLK